MEPEHEQISIQRQCEILGLVRSIAGDVGALLRAFQTLDNLKGASFNFWIWNTIGNAVKATPYMTMDGFSQEIDKGKAFLLSQ